MSYSVNVGLKAKGFYLISSHVAFTGNCSENALHSIFSSFADIGSVYLSVVFVGMAHSTFSLRHLFQCF